jgi:hypothetical protein
MCNWEGKVSGRMAEAREKARQNPTFISTIADSAARPPFPASIEKATDNQIYGRPFYKKKVLFDVEVSGSLDHRLVFTTKMSYTVVNKTSSNQDWSAEYQFDHGNGKILLAELNGKPHNPVALEFQSGRGLRIKQPVKAHKELDVTILAQEQWPNSGSALYTSYHPAADFKLTLRSQLSNIEFDFEILYSWSDYPLQEKSEGWEINLGPGLLPYQGVKVNWKMKEEKNGDS